MLVSSFITNMFRLMEPYCSYIVTSSDVTRGLKAQSLAEGGPSFTIRGPLAKTQKKVKKW